MSVRLPGLQQLSLNPTDEEEDPALQEAIERSLKDEEEELQRAIMLSLQHSDASSAESAKELFAVMVLGGSPAADPKYKAAFPNCNVFTVGDHSTADIKRDWTDPDLWKAAAARNPDAVIIDFGSDSWIREQKIAEYLAQLLKTTKAALLVSPPNNAKDNWYDVMSPVPFFGDGAYQLRYRVTLLATEPSVLFAFRHDFEEKELLPSQEMMLAQECLKLMYEDREGIADERRECYKRRELRLGKGMEWYDALQLQLSYLTQLVSAPASAVPLPVYFVKRLPNEVDNPLEWYDRKTPMKDVTVKLEDLPTGVDPPGLYPKQVVYAVDRPGEGSYQIAARLPSDWPFAAPRFYIKAKKTGPKITEDGDVWWNKGDWVNCKRYVEVITRKGEPLDHLAPLLGWDDKEYDWLHEMLTDWSPAVFTSYYVSRLKTDEVIDRVLQAA